TKLYSPSFLVSFCRYEAFLLFLFFFNATGTSESYTLSLHDALPISGHGGQRAVGLDDELVEQQHRGGGRGRQRARQRGRARVGRSEEHTSELQSRVDLVCRLLLEKKKQTKWKLLGMRLTEHITLRSQ